MMPDMLSEAKLKKNSSTLFATERKSTDRCTGNPDVSVKSPCPLGNRCLAELHAVMPSVIGRVQATVGRLIKPELQTMRQRTVDTFRGARLSSPRIYELIVEFEREAPVAPLRKTFTRCSASQTSKNKSGNQDGTTDSNAARPRRDSGSFGRLRPGFVRTI